MPDEQPTPTSAAAPTDMLTLTERHCENSYAFGFGAETGQSIACPFCGAKDFMKMRVVAAREDGEKEWTCAACERSAKLEFHGPDDHLVFFLAQTGGPEQPEWMTPKIHKVGERPEVSIPPLP